MNPEAIKNSIQAVVDGLTPLAQQLRIPIEGLFSWAIKHNYAVAAGDLVMAVFMACLIYVYYRFIRWCYQDIDRLDDHMIIVILGGILSAIVFLIMLGCVWEGMQRLIAPEWHAMQDIANLIKSR